MLLNSIHRLDMPMNYFHPSSVVSLILLIATQAFRGPKCQKEITISTFIFQMGHLFQRNKSFCLRDSQLSSLSFFQTRMALILFCKCPSSCNLLKERQFSQRNIQLQVDLSHSLCCLGCRAEAVGNWAHESHDILMFVVSKRTNGKPCYVVTTLLI